MEATPTAIPPIAPQLLLAVCSARGERLSANDAWTRHFGDDDLWSALPPEDRRFADEYIAEAAQGSLVTNQVFLVAQNGREVPILLHFLPVRTPDVRPGAYLVTLTGEVLQEPATWAAEQTRRRRMEMLGQMAMGIAHDFNNLLTGILGNTELLRGALESGAASGSELTTYLDTLQRAANDGAALVRKIQGYIRHEKQERFEHVDLGRLTEEVLDLTKPYWYNEPRRQGIRIELARDLADVPPIEGFATELREVLVNLVLNAVQAMPEGGILSLSTRSSDAGAVLLEVRDTGVGMPEHVRTRIFEPLFTTKGERGTGMGLTVAYGIVQEHRGEFRVDSTPGEGTCFVLSFPTAEAPAPAPTKKAPVVEGARPRRVLVVDDEPMVRTVTARLLRVKGHEVVEASGGNEALGEIAEAPFDLVLTDLSMPEMNGRELAFRIRQHHPRQPIILLTGDTDADDEFAHVDAVVKKPFQLEELESLIQRTLNRDAVV